MVEMDLGPICRVSFTHAELTAGCLRARPCGQGPRLFVRPSSASSDRVQFDRLFDGTEIRGNLLVEAAGDDVRQHFAFPRRQTRDWSLIDANSLRSASA